MYALEVYFPNEDSPRHVESTTSASEVLARVSTLMAEHDGCEKVVVYLGSTRLFSADCKGNTSPG